MIEKGQRDPVLGYKPQIGRSANGFISAFEVLPGNPADSTRVVELTVAHARNTGVTPCLVGTDDGYSAQSNLDDLAVLGVETVSFSGAKGRDLLGDEMPGLVLPGTVPNARFSPRDPSPGPASQGTEPGALCPQGLSGKAPAIGRCHT